VEPWDHLEVVVECVVSPTWIMLNDLMPHPHIIESNPTTMPLNFKSSED
jgi:hypothetical protein